ncbi:MAG TPA: family 16 glycoside hydrolase [Verrucomicrobiae bacterium]
MKTDMKALAAFALLTGLLCGSALADTVNFDDLKAGAPPPGWTASRTGKGDAKWEIVADDSAPSKTNVLRQSGEATYPVCFKNDASLKDGFVAVKFKAVSGKIDQAGGVIWRCQDADNYYIARANALEDNITIYHTIKGKRVSLKNIDTTVAPGVWHTLRVEFKGNKFAVIFDSKKVIEATDDSFSDAGKVGVWTKADSVTLFDDFSYGSK